MDELNFYNKQFETHGGYDHGHKKDDERSDDHPEKRFEQLVQQHSSSEKVLVDLGCGDGKFTADLAKFNQQVIGIEPSKLIQAALCEKQKLRIENLSFLEESAENLSLADASVDLVISRRGPDPATEIARILKPNGLFIFITIGEQDCLALKRLVGRGQLYDAKKRAKNSENDAELPRKTVSDQLTEKFTFQGFSVLNADDCVYQDDIESPQALIDFLHQVPIFDQFNDQDYSAVKRYCEGFSEQLIHLTRHRVILVAKKSY